MRLIDADMLEKELCDICGLCDIERTHINCQVIKIIKSMSTIESEPIICGEWEDISHITSEPTIRCSECWVDFPMPKKDKGKYIYPNFCPHCGADTRGTDNETDT